MVIKNKLARAAFLVGGLFDGRDLLLYAGLGLIAYGVWPVYPPASFIVPGAVLALVAIFGTR